MKLLKIYLLLFLSSVVSASPNDSLFQQANKDYQKQAYQQALQNYQLIDSLIHSHALYHNMGNCYYFLGDIPRSILNYERAILIKRDNATLENLRVAKKRILEIDTIPPLFLVSWWDNITSALKPNQWATVMLLSLWISICFLALFLKYRRKIFFNIFIINLVISILIISTANRSHATYEDKYGVIISKTELVEGEENINIAAGNKVKILKEGDAMLKVELPNGSIGYVSKFSLIKIK